MFIIWNLGDFICFFIYSETSCLTFCAKNIFLEKWWLWLELLKMTLECCWVPWFKFHQKCYHHERENLKIASLNSRPCLEAAGVQRQAVRGRWGQSRPRERRGRISFLLAKIPTQTTRANSPFSIPTKGTSANPPFSIPTKRTSANPPFSIPMLSRRSLGEKNFCEPDVPTITTPSQSVRRTPSSSKPGLQIGILASQPEKKMKCSENNCIFLNFYCKFLKLSEKISYCNFLKYTLQKSSENLLQISVMIIL